MHGVGDLILMPEKGGGGVLCQPTCVLAMSLDDSSVHIVGCSGTKGNCSGFCLRFPCSFSPLPSLLPVHMISFRPMRGIFFEVMTSRPPQKKKKKKKIFIF
jgi:hypothetical protein